MKNDITITVYKDKQASIKSLFKISKEEALNYAKNGEIIRLDGLSESALVIAVFNISLERIINALYDSGVLAYEYPYTWANYYIEATRLEDFINLVEEEGERWTNYIRVKTCREYALDNMPAELRMYANYIDLEGLGASMARHSGLHVTEDKHVVRIL